MKQLLLNSFVAIAVVIVTGGLALDPNQGTTQNIQSIFIGRCWDYAETKYRGILPRVATDCNTLWNHFSQAFAFRAPCDMNQNLYKPYLQAAKQTLPANKVMFWSGVYNLAHMFSNTGINYVTLEDTLIGYLANSLTWCGQKKTPGIDYSRCPSWSDCPLEASESFWAAASTTFAAQAVGTVVLMVDGSNPSTKAYRQDSFFGKYELPSLVVGKVSTVQVMVIHALGQQKVSVMHLMCASNPGNRECKLAAALAKRELVYTSDPLQSNQMPDVFG